MPFDGEDPIEKAHALVRELGKYSDTLLAKPRWVVVNKLDLVPAEDREELVKKLHDALCPDGRPFFAISAATREGTKEVVMAIAQFLDQISGCGCEAHRHQGRHSAADGKRPGAR